MGGYLGFVVVWFCFCEDQASIDAWVYTCWSCLLLSVGERVFQLSAGAGDIGSS